MMFLVRPLPLVGESLSSWRQRGGLANGFFRFPLHSTRSYAKDFDKGISAAEEEWLCASFRIRPEALEEMTLEHFCDGALIHSRALKKPRWVIPIGYREGGIASVYCPKCLAEDEVPYFRLTWRLAFICTCPLHGCGLRERCGACNAPVWPATLKTLPAKQMKDLGHCPFCAVALQDGLGGKADSFSLPLARAIDTGLIPEEVSQCLQLPDLFDGLWSLAQLLLRRSCSRLRRVLPFDTDRAGSTMQNVELLSLDHRKDVLENAYWLMQDWPDRFIGCMKAAGLSRSLVAKSKIPFPRWFSDVLDSDLTLRIRGVSAEQITNVVTRLEASGRPVTKSAVRRVLGVSEAQELNKLLFQRRRATQAELSSLCANFDKKLASAPARRDERATMLRDYLMVLLVVLTKRRVEQVCCMSLFEVEEVLASSPQNQQSTLVDKARALNSEYSELVRPKFTNHGGNGGPWFISRFGRQIEGHSVRARVASLMQSGFVNELYKSIDVFRNLLPSER